MNLRSPIVVAAAVGSVAAGCGSGSGSDADQIKAAVTTYLSALADGDGEKACGELTGDQKRIVVAAGQGAGIGGGSCPDVLNKISANLDAQERSILRDAKVERVTIRGDGATVALHGTPNAPLLTKAEGGWLISGGLFPGVTDDAAIRRRIDAAEQQLSADPQDEQALAQVIRGHYEIATANTDPNTGQFTSAALPDLHRAATAWERYLATSPDRPGASLARVMIQAYAGLAQGVPRDTQAQSRYWAGAATAAEVITGSQPSPTNYIALVQYASLAGQSAKADLAGKKAIELAPASRRRAVAQQVAAAKAVGNH